MLGSMFIHNKLHVEKDCWKRNDFRVSSRIINDIGMLYSQINNMQICKKNNVHIIEFKFNNHQYHFELLSNYPFVCPSVVSLDGANYSTIKRMPSERFAIALTTKLNIKWCLCCESVMCAGNWTPVLTLANIVNEIDSVLKIYQKIIIHVLCDTIRNKHNLLCDFANFEKYLFKE